MADTAIWSFTDGATAAATDRIAAVRSPGGAGDDRYLTPAYIKDYILGLSNTFTRGQIITQATANEAILASTGYSLTGSSTVSMIDLAGTWNTSGVPIAIKLNITDTASTALSPLVDLQVGGVKKFTVSKEGILWLNQSSATSGTYTLWNSSSTTYVNTNSGGEIQFAVNNAPQTKTGALGFKVLSASSYSWSSDTANISATSDVHLYRDAAQILAQRDPVTANSPQTYRWYGRYASSTDYHRGALSVVRTTLSGVTGASVTATNLIPDGALVVGVTTKVTTALGATGGTTGYQVGDGSDPDRWGEATTITLGTTTDNTNATATTVTMFIAANNVVITAVGGNFDATGVIDVNVFYLIAQAD